MRGQAFCGEAWDVRRVVACTRLVRDVVEQDDPGGFASLVDGVGRRVLVSRVGSSSGEVDDLTRIGRPECLCDLSSFRRQKGSKSVTSSGEEG